MDKKILKNDKFTLSKWSGGNTRELAIYPEDSKYLERDFIWRLSSADSDLEESSFTKLPDFDRILLVLDGEVVLAHGEERTTSLRTGEQDSFDGALKTKCFGKLKKDYNLIMRKGCRGRMEMIDAKSEGKIIKTGRTKETDNNGMGGESSSIGVFCYEGYAVVSLNGESEMLKADELMVIDCGPEEKAKLSVMGDGRCIFTEVIFERQSVSAPEVPKAKASSEDFALALKLFAGNNKWSALLRRERKKGDYMAPQLEKKLKTLDKFFITGIVWIIGVLACLMTHLMGWDPIFVFALIVLYSLLDFLLISPLIYMAVLPKPIRAYLKKPEELNAYERKLYDEQISSDPHHEKLMHKYRDRTGETYEGMGDFIRKLNK